MLWPEMAELSTLDDADARRGRRKRQGRLPGDRGASRRRDPGRRPGRRSRRRPPRRIDQPDELNALLLEFLARHRLRPIPRPTAAATRRPPSRRTRGRSGSASAIPASGSTQRNVPLRPKWPNVRGEFRAPVQCGDLPSRSSKPSPQSFGSCRPKPGSTPTSPGNWTVVASASVSGASRVRRLQLAREREQVVERALDARAGRAVEHGRRALPTPTRSTPRTASRRAPRRAPPRPRSRSSSRCGACRAARSARPARTGAPTHARAGAGTSTRAGRRARRGRRSPPRPRRASRPRPRASSPTPTAKRRVDVAVRRLDRAGHRDRRVLAWPPVDLAQRVHGGETSDVERQLHLVRRRVRGARRLLARRARRRPRLGLRHRADHARRRRPPAGAVRAGEGLPRDHRARARGGGRERSTTSCARGSTSPTRRSIDEVGRAHGEAFAQGAPGDDRDRHAAARPALAGRDRGGGGDTVSREADLPAVDHRQGRDRAGAARARASSTTASARATRTRSASRRSTCCSTPRRGISCSTSTPCSPRSRTASTRSGIHAELMQSVLEVTTPVCRTAGDVHARARAAARLRRRDRARRGLPLRLGRHASVQPLRAPAHHRARPLPPARRPAAVHRAARADLRHAHARRGRRSREGDPGDERPARAPAADARAVGVVAVLARRADRALVEPADGVRRVPALGPAAALQGLRRLRGGRRPARAHRLHRRLHAHLVGHPPASAARARSRCACATP